MSDLISIIVPAYNIENYINYSLKSILNQTYKNIEIILINDGSMDNTLRICQDYANLDNRIKILTHDNHGVSYTRNRGLKEAKGEYIIFVDGDDYIYPYHIESLYQSLKQTNTDLCISNCQKISLNEIQNNNIPTPLTKEEKNYQLSAEQVLEKVIYSQKDFGWEVAAKLYKKSVLKDIYFDEKEAIAEDFTFFYKALHHCKNVSLCLNSSYLYIIRSGSAMSKGYSARDEKLLETSHNFKAHIDQYYPHLQDCASTLYTYTHYGLFNKLILLSDEKKYLDKQQIHFNYLKNNFYKTILNKKIPTQFKLKLGLLMLNQKLYKKLYIRSINNRYK